MGVGAGVVGDGATGGGVVGAGVLVQSHWLTAGWLTWAGDTVAAWAVPPRSTAGPARNETPRTAEAANLRGCLNMFRIVTSVPAPILQFLLAPVPRPRDQAAAQSDKPHCSRVTQARQRLTVTSVPRDGRPGR